ncbi:myosin-4-like [Oryza brachyantha]|uniref:Uncharacterized protein n=1 Tax=Oryza brachyantha TaxID=4533 RepID=J3L9S0_ORYBR|nr:myosin-4-like [Oryza brachyantha]
MAALALSSLETMLNSLIGRPKGGGGGDDVLVNIDGALDSPPPPPLPARPSPRRRRRPSQPPRVIAVGTSRPSMPSPPPPQSSSSREEEEAAAALVEELERKAVMAEARLRQKEEENAAMLREFDSYHVRWLQYEIRLSSLKETIDEHKASLQMAQESAERSHEMLPLDRHPHESSKPHMKVSEDTPAVVARRNAPVSRAAGAEHRQQQQQNQALVVVEPREPWQPGAPDGNSVDDLEKLKSQFSAWKKDYKARLRKAAMAELNRERRHRSSCWI